MSTDVTAMAQLPSDMRDAFDRLAEDAVGEFGPTPLARLVLAHLVLFAELRRRGASWAQIADLLAAAGVIGSDGPFTADVVRATYARTAKTAAAAECKRTGRNATKRDEGNSNAAKGDVTQRNAAERTETKPSRTSRRISSGTIGLPQRHFDFQHRYDLKPARCQRTRVSGLTIAKASQTLGNSR